ncbi:MAG: hypothetical protein GEU82_18425 [Luteitalea sp.]|nr:hypothetical protein [Luteitalea sp.]
MNRIGVLALGALFGACGPAERLEPEKPVHAVRAEVAPPAFVGVVWLSADPSAPPGSLRIFLPDGTLVMDSCWETYRLARWRSIDERRIEWQEDTARIEADVSQPTVQQLELRLGR